MARRRRIPPNPTLFPCRYCLDDDHPQNLISPCICQGSVKYIHNQCLMRWYTAYPEKGLECSICKTPCAYQVNQPLELPLSAEFTANCGIHNPFLVVFIYNWIQLFVWSYLLNMTEYQQMKGLYVLFQQLFTVLYAALFGFVVYRIRQKTVYMQKWLFSTRMAIPLFHAYCFWLLPRYWWIGGVAANLCSFQYFYVHMDILEEMNGKVTFQFINRPRPVLQLPPS